MFKNEGSRGDLNGFLDAGSRIDGELRFEDTFRVDGKVIGRVSSKGDLVVGESGEVQGEIHVARVFVSGTVHGSIVAAEKVELATGCKVFADVDSPSLLIEEGAFLQGRCSMGEASQQAAKVAQMPLPKA